MRHIAVVGSRTFCPGTPTCDHSAVQPYALMVNVLADYDPFILVSGGAHGADSLAARFAHDWGYQKLIIRPAWNTEGRAAGMLRNQAIVDAADELIAFWDGESRGTADSINRAHRKRIRVTVVQF